MKTYLLEKSRITSQLKGEAGRQALNLAQRDLLEISRLRACVQKKYVLVRTDAAAAGCTPAWTATG